VRPGSGDWYGNGTIAGMNETRDPRPAESAKPVFLEGIAAEIEQFAAQAGWDRPPMLYALVPTRVLASDPDAAAVLSPDNPLTVGEIGAEALTPIAQEELPDEPLDDILAQIGWPQEVVGCAVSQEIVMLPPSAEAELSEVTSQVASAHPDRREARLVVIVLRDGSSASLLRLRGIDGHDDELLTGDNLAPNLLAALADTLSD